MAESVYKIQVNVEGFWNKQDDGRKVYVKEKTLTWVVDSDRSSLCEFNSDLLKDLGWGKYQIPRFWILDKKEGTQAKLVSESQIPEMFKMYEKERLIFLHVVVCDLEKSSNCIGTNAAYPCTPVQPTPGIEIGSQSQAGSYHEDVSLNDEHIYDGDGDGKTDLCLDVQFDLVDGDSDGVVHHEPIMTYDPENPKIEVGASFPDVAAFRKSLRHFAIKNEFEIGDIKTDKKRFRGKCAEVSGVDSEKNYWRYVVELNKHECSCRKWQITGIPCMHAIAFICTLRGAELEDYVHEYYSVARFRAAYAGRIPALDDKAKWEKANLDFN